MLNTVSAFAVPYYINKKLQNKLEGRIFESFEEFNKVFKTLISGSDLNDVTALTRGVFDFYDWSILEDFTKASRYDQIKGIQEEVISLLNEEDQADYRFYSFKVMEDRIERIVLVAVFYTRNCRRIIPRRLNELSLEMVRRFDKDIVNYSIDSNMFSGLVNSELIKYILRRSV